MNRIDSTVSQPMSFYSGELIIPKNNSHPMDTFIRLDGWAKVCNMYDLLLMVYYPVIKCQFNAK